MPRRVRSDGMSANLIIALESSGLSTSVALGRLSPESGVTLLDQRQHTAEARSTAKLLPAMRELLDAAGARLGDVSVVGFVRGPGSFTGLRVAATIATMMQSVCGCAV